jgi:hypothetical protein
VASTIKIKRSSVAGKVPLTTDLTTGEIAINTKDKKLYSSNGTAVFEIGSQLNNLTVSGNTTVAGVKANNSLGTSGQVLKTNGTTSYWGTDTAAVGTTNQILYRNSSNTLTGSSGLQYDGVSIKVNGNLESVYSNGNEGGEIFLNKPATGTTITNGVTIDVYQDRLRIFENGGTNRGAYIDISAAATGVGSNLLAGGGTSSNGFSGILVGSNVVVADSTSDRLTFVAGSGMTIAANPTTDTITFSSSGGAASNGFSGILVGSNVISADSSTDRLTFVAGSKISLAANPTTDTITIAAQTNEYLQVANAVATYQTKAVERAALANTNARITLVNQNLTGTNTALRTLISDRLQVANAVATYETKTTANARLANTNAYIATKVNTTTFNSALANTNSFIKSQLANTNAYIATRASWTALTSTNTALRTLINDRLQVANADAKFATKAYAAANSYVNNTFLKRTGSQASAQSVNTNVAFSANVSIQGKLTVTGGITSYFANNVSTSDNMIYLNANSIVSNPDLGFAGNYNDGTYAHAGFFRDASDAGTFKVFHKYTLEPDANVYINTAHASFELAPFAAQNIRAARNLVVVANSTLGNTSVSGFLKLNGTDIRTTFAQNTYVKSILANTNARINLLNTNLTGTNTALRILINQKLSQNDVVTTYQTIAVERAALANTNARINLINTNLTGTNTALRALISDRLQVANASTLYATKSNPTTSGFLNHTGRATISTNLIVSGNTSIVGLRANNSFGSAGQVLKTNGTSVYWSADVSGSSGGFANGQSISVLNLTVTGNTTLGGAGKTITSTGAITHTGRARISTNLYVAGNTVLGDPTNISERTTINGTLFANGNINLNGNTFIGAAGKIANATGWFGVNGRATVGTNLFVGGNTNIRGLIANGSLGTANFVLKTNGTTTFWGAAASGGGVTLADETASATTHYPTMSTTSTGSWTAGRVSTTKLYFTPSTGQLNATIFNSLSDKRVKKNIKTFDDALETVNNMRGVKFNWKETDTPSIGLIAQEVEKLLPQLVHTSDNGEKSINYGGVVGVLIEAIKELTSRVEKLEGK